MKAKKWTFLLTSIATLALVTACTQSTSNTTASNTATSTTSTTNAKKTSYFTDKDYDTSYDEKTAAEFAKRMMEKGVYVVAFSYPVVPKGKARIRTQVCASHTKEDIDFIVKCFIEVREEMGLNK